MRSETSSTGLPDPEPPMSETVGSRESPEILAIGSLEMTEKLSRALEQTSATVRRLASLEEARDHVGPTTIALILAATDETDHNRPIELVDRLAHEEGLDHLPLFVVVDESFEAEYAQSLYESGATVVFAWPSELLLMPRIMVEMLDVSMQEHAEQSADLSLTEALRAHLEVDNELGGDIDCEVRGGCAILRGEVDSLWKKRRLLGLVEHVPGVMGVIAQDVRVRPPATPDPVLGDTIMAALRSAAPIDPDTLCISVLDGAVTIAGTAASRSELRQVQSIVENTEGVRRVENLATVSPEAARQAHDIVEGVKETLAQKFPGATLDISLLGNVVVLRGHVQTLALRRQIEQAILDEVEGVQRVVNKLSLVGAPEAE